MLTDPSLQIQRAIVKRLRDSAELTALLSKRVYDAAPDKPTFPYISLGPSIVQPELAECTDAADSSMQIDIWSRSVGFPECKKVAREVISSLHDEDLPLEGDGVVQSLLLESARYVRDPDGLTSHGIVTFSILTDANA